MMTHWMYPGPFGPGRSTGERCEGRGLDFSEAARTGTGATKPVAKAPGSGGNGASSASFRASRRPNRRWTRGERSSTASSNARGSRSTAVLMTRSWGGDSVGDSPGASVWVVRVELVTGRTHQVRAQPPLRARLFSAIRSTRRWRATFTTATTNVAAEEAWGRMERGTVPDWPSRCTRRRCGGGIPCFRPRHRGTNL